MDIAHRRRPNLREVYASKRVQFQAPGKRLCPVPGGDDDDDDDPLLSGRRIANLR